MDLAKIGGQTLPPPPPTPPFGHSKVVDQGLEFSLLHWR